MATRREVLCINKSNKTSEHEKITTIGGGKIADGTKWRFSQKEAVDAIENKTYEFYVTKGDKTADVIVIESILGNKYLRTEKDSTKADNLLSLPECL